MTQTTMTQTTTNSSLDRDELVDGLFTATVGTLELFGVYLGHRLGLYPALAEHADMTADELAAATGVAPRYAREWLEQQGVGGFLAVAAGDVGERRFSLPAAHRDVLADEENLAYVAPFALLVAGIGQALPEVVDAYRTRRGVPWAVYGADARDGQAAINRPAFLQEMEAWMASMPDVHARLQADPPARVADLGCGADWSTIGLARAFPKAEVTGFDIDGASIADAARNATRAGVADCVTFAVHDAADPVPRAPYDLVCIFEALHDMHQPVEALAAGRAALIPGGSVLVVDERVADELLAPAIPSSG